MKDASAQFRYSNCDSKSDKIELNLSKIRGLIKVALSELKKQERISTNASETSQSHSPQFIHRISMDLHAQKTQMMLQSLHKGYVMVKHSANTKPKQKYIYISEDSKFLCWKSLEKDDQKQIQLRKISNILRGKDQTICYIKSKTIRSLETCIIIRSEIRNLQLQALNAQESMKFQLQMEEAIKNAKSIHLSYKI